MILRRECMMNGGLITEYSEAELGRRDAELAAGLGVAIGLIAIELVSMPTAQEDPSKL
jgi:hypothetical protein